MLSSCHHLQLVLFLYLCLTAGLWATANGRDDMSEEHVTNSSDERSSPGPPSPEEAHGQEDDGIGRSRTLTAHGELPSTGNATVQQGMQVIANLLDSVLLSGRQHSTLHAFTRRFDRPQMQPPRGVQIDNNLNGTHVLPTLLETSCTGVTYASFLRNLDYPVPHYFSPLVLSDAVVIREHPETHPYEALLMFGMKSPQHHHPYGLYAYVFEVGENSGQTIRVHDFLDLSFLPVECQNPNTFLPVIALSVTRDLVFIYNFGVSLSCSKLIIYNPSNRSIQHVETTGDELVPRWFSSMVSVRLTNDVMTDTIYVFGGTHCHPDKILKCVNFSDAIFQMRFTNASMLYGNWRNIAKGGNSSQPSGRVSSALFVGSNDTLILYGGISVGAHFTSANGSHKAECDLWLFNTDTGDWLNRGNLELDCDSRDSSSCFGCKNDHPSPRRPWAAYSTATSEISVLSFRFRKTYSSKWFEWCGVNSITVSRRLLNRDGQYKWRFYNSTAKRWLSPPLTKFYDGIFGVATVAIGHSHYMVAFTQMRLLSVSSTFDSKSGKNAVSFELLPTLDNAFQFAGSLGCITSPIVMVKQSRSFETADFPGPHALMVGGYCALPSHPRYIDFFSPAWRTMPVWRYSASRTYVIAQYEMRIIEPGPPFHSQFLHTLVMLENEQNVTKAILFGGVSLLDGPLNQSMWCLDTREFYWTKANITSPAAGAPYQHNRFAAGHVAVALNGHSFLVYGGFDVVTLSGTNEFFLFTFSNLSSCTGHWTNLSAPLLATSGSTLPKRFLHCATLWQGRVFIYGGIGSLYTVEGSPLFMLRISTSPILRVHLEITHFSAPLGPRLSSSLIPYNSEMLIVFGGIVIDTSTLKVVNNLSTVSALIHVNPANNSKAQMLPFFQHYPIAFQHLSEGIIVTFGGGFFFDNSELTSAEAAITYSKFCQLKLPSERCPLGYGYSKENNTCYDCDIGSMSDTTEGPCQPCPQYQTTNSTRATSCYTPNPCHDKFCHGHGSCSVRNHIDAYCESCDFGYWQYDNCQAPFIHIFISTSVAIAVAFLFCLIKRIRDARKKTKRQERDLVVTKWHLKQLKNGVIVQWSELELERVLGEGASGQVHLAKLGDINVAVKALRRCRMNDNIFLERFSKEIENMRTVRHPNIVMFLGAGTEPTLQFPFIVMEHVTRGSLFNILQCSEVFLTLERKVKFGIDVGKGLEFLHSSTTPRIHCDLKSSNLLVTSKWTVKIGDFGMLRLISTIRDYDDTDPEDNLMENSPVFSRGTTSWEDTTSTVPLLQDESDGTGRNLTLAMGTVRWCSPETLRHHVLNKYTDVYSYGIVLWEVLTRQLPYNHVDDEDQVVEEIKNGWRPPIPPAHPQAYKYKRLMEACWSDEPEQRPLFPEIVEEMEEQLHGMSVAGGTTENEDVSVVAVK